MLIQRYCYLTHFKLSSPLRCTIMDDMDLTTGQ